MHWETYGGRYLALSQALASDHHQAMGERAEGEKPLLSLKKAMDWIRGREVLVFDVDTEIMTISLPDRKISELWEMLEDWPGERNKATVRELLVLNRKTTPRSVRNQIREVLGAAASSAVQAESEEAGKKRGGGGG